MPGSQGGGVIWRNFMQVATRGQVPQLFRPPPGLVQSAVCGYPEYFLRSAVPRVEECTKPSPVEQPPPADPAVPVPTPTPTVIPVWTPLPVAGRPVVGPGAAADAGAIRAANPGRAASGATGRLGSAFPCRFIAPAAQSIDNIRLKFYTSYCHRLRSLGLVRCQPHADGAAAPGNISGPTKW